MDQFKNHEVYEKVPIAEAGNSGTKLITTRWVDINKGDEEKPKYRSRLVARVAGHARCNRTVRCHATVGSKESAFLEGND